MKFAPDAPESTPGVLLEVNMLPTVRGYKAAPALDDAGFAALAASAQGAALVFKLNGSRRLFAGTAAGLYEGSAGTWTDRSRVGGYSIGGLRWQFAQFGDTTFAIAGGVQLQSSSTAAFADVANAPKAECMDAASGFLMLGNTDDTGTGLSTAFGAQQHRWWCSQLFNPSGTWAPSVTTQATTGLLVSTPGPIKAVKALGEQCVYYKERGMHLGTYVGPPEVWRFERVPVEAGAVSAESVVAVGNVHYFIGVDDIWRFDGTRPVPISEGIREWFFARLNKVYAYLIAGVHDPASSSIWWWYPAGTSTQINEALVFNYVTGTWGRVDMSVTLPLYLVRTGLTYDSLGSEYTTYEDLPPAPYNSPVLDAGAPELAVFAGATLYTISGVPQASSFVTGWTGDKDRYSLATRVRLRLRVKPATQSMQARALDELGGTISTTNCVYNVDRFDLLQNARWHQFSANFSGPVEVEDVAVALKPTGYE